MHCCRCRVILACRQRPAVHVHQRARVPVEINGTGIYTYDSFFKAPILQGTDAITLLVVLPLLVIALIWA